MPNFFQRLFGQIQPPKPATKRTYSGAKSTGLNVLDWKTSGASVNSELFQAIRPLRERSRELYRNDPYAKSAVNTFVYSVIGKGMSLQAKIEMKRGGKLNDRLNTQIEETWNKWAEKGNCTPCRRFSMGMLQRQIIKSMIVDGEVLLRVIKKKVGKSRIPVALEVIEADQLDDRRTAGSYGNNRIIMGVEVNEWGAAIAYHLLPYHPGDYQFQAKNYDTVKRVLAEDIIHLFVNERPGQVRGIPWLHNVIDRIKNLSGYEEAEIIRSRVQSCAVGAITSPEPDALTDTTDSDSSDYKFLSPGEILRLAPGEEFTMGNAAAPNPSLEGFFRTIARSIAAGIGVSYESLTRDFSNTSYSSARTALLAERDLYEVLQSEFIETFLCPFYLDHWLPMAVTGGVLPVVGYELNEEFYEKHRWTRRGWPWVDPLKDLQASELALRLNLTTLTRELAGQGIDIEDLLKERAAEKELLKQYGLDSGEEESAGTEAAQSEEPEEAVPIMEGFTPVGDEPAATVEPTPEATETETALEPARSFETDKAIATLARTIEVLSEKVGENRISSELLTGLRELRQERNQSAESQQEITINFNGLPDGLMPDVVEPGEVEEEIVGDRDEDEVIGDRSIDQGLLIREGMTPLDALQHRAAGEKPKGKQCKKGQVCGNSCISQSKTCRKGLNGAQKEKAKTAKSKTTKTAKGKTTKPAKGITPIQPNPFADKKFDLSDYSVPFLLDIVSIKPTKKVKADPEQVDKMADALLAGGGNIKPLIVRQTGLNQFEVVEGHSQFLALQRAKEKNPSFELSRALVLNYSDGTSKNINKLNDEAIIEQVKLLKKFPREVSPESSKSSPKPITDGYDLKNYTDYQLVDISSIKSTAKKGDVPDDDIEQLARSYLNGGGNINPYILRRTGPDDFEVVSGQKEFLAAQRAKELVPSFEMVRGVILSPKNSDGVLYQLNNQED